MWQSNPAIRAMRDARPAADARFVLQWVLKRVMLAIGAGLLILAIPIAIVTPILPVGLPLAVVGLLILLNNSNTAKRWFVRWGKRHPITMRRVRAVLRGKRR